MVQFVQLHQITTNCNETSVEGNTLHRKHTWKIWAVQTIVE